MAAIDESCDSNPNFAIICSFMTKFGNECGVQVTIPALQQMLEDTKNISEELKEIHIHLLRKGRKRVNKEKWEKSLIKFCHEYSSIDAWELERFGYKKAKLSVKLEILKRLLELQFDHNAKFKAEVNKQDSRVLRVLPVGRDIDGNMYWYQLDNDFNMRLYRQDTNEENTWHLLCSTKEGLADLLMSLGKQSIKGKDIISEIIKSASMEKVPEDEDDEAEIIKKEAGELKEDRTATLSPNKPCAIIIKTEKKEPLPAHAAEDNRTILSRTEKKTEIIEQSLHSPKLTVPVKDPAKSSCESDLRTVKQESDLTCSETKCSVSDISKCTSTTTTDANKESKTDISDASNSEQIPKDSHELTPTENSEETCVNLKIVTSDNTSTKTPSSTAVDQEKQYKPISPENSAVISASLENPASSELTLSRKKDDPNSELKLGNQSNIVEPFSDLKFKGSKIKLYQKWSHEKKMLSSPILAHGQNVCDFSMKSSSKPVTNYSSDHNDIPKPMDLSSPTKESVPFQSVTSAAGAEAPMDLSCPSVAKPDGMPTERLIGGPTTGHEEKGDGKTSRNSDFTSRTNTSKILHSTDNILSKPFKKKHHLMPENRTDVSEQSRHSVICEVKGNKQTQNASERHCSSAVVSNIHSLYNNVPVSMEKSKDSEFSRFKTKVSSTSTPSKTRPLSPKAQKMIDDELRPKKLKLSCDLTRGNSDIKDFQLVVGSKKDLQTTLDVDTTKCEKNVKEAESSGKPQCEMDCSVMDLKMPKKAHHDSFLHKTEELKDCDQDTAEATHSIAGTTKHFKFMNQHNPGIGYPRVDPPTSAPKSMREQGLLDHPPLPKQSINVSEKLAEKLKTCIDGPISSYRQESLLERALQPDSSAIRRERKRSYTDSATGESRKFSETKGRTLNAISEKLFACKAKVGDKHQDYFVEKSHKDESSMSESTEEYNLSKKSELQISSPATSITNESMSSLPEKNKQAISKDLLYDSLSISKDKSIFDATHSWKGNVSTDPVITLKEIQDIIPPSNVSPTVPASAKTNNQKVPNLEASISEFEKNTTSTEEPKSNEKLLCEPQEKRNNYSISKVEDVPKQAIKECGTLQPKGDKLLLKDKISKENECTTDEDVKSEITKDSNIESLIALGSSEEHPKSKTSESSCSSGGKITENISDEVSKNTETVESSEIQEVIRDISLTEQNQFLKKCAENVLGKIASESKKIETPAEVVSSDDIEDFVQTISAEKSTAETLLKTKDISDRGVVQNLVNEPKKKVDTSSFQLKDSKKFHSSEVKDAVKEVTTFFYTSCEGDKTSISSQQQKLHSSTEEKENLTEGDKMHKSLTSEGNKPKVEGEIERKDLLCLSKLRYDECSLKSSEKESNSVTKEAQECLSRLELTLRKESTNDSITRIEKSFTTTEEKDSSVTFRMKKQIDISDAENLMDLSDTEKLMYILDTEKPMDISDTEKSMEISDTEKPLDISDTEKPMDISDKEKPMDISDKEKPMDISDIIKSIAIPEMKKTTSISETDKLTVISTMESSTTSSPEKSTSDRERSTSDTEKSTTMPEAKKLTAFLQQENSSTPEVKNSNVLLKAETTIAILDVEKTIAIPDVEKTIAISNVKKIIALPEGEKITAIPEVEKVIIVPESKKLTVIPELKKSTIPEGEKTIAAIAKGKRLVEIPEGEKSAAIGKVKKSLVISESDESSVVREVDKSAALLAMDKSATLLAMGKSAALLAMGKSAAIPEEDKSAAIPEADKSAAIPEADKSAATPEVTKSTSIPEAKKSVAIPKVGKPAAIPEMEKQAAMTVVEKQAARTEVEKSVAIPAVKKSPVISKTEESMNIVSETKMSTGIPETEKSTAFSETEGSTAISDKEKSTAIPESEKLTAIPESEKLTAIPKAEKSKIPNKETESSTIITEKEKTTATPEKEKSTISEKEKPTVSEKEKSTISEKEKPTISEKEKPTISEKEKPTISEEEKSTISVEEKSTISEKQKSTISEKQKSTISEKEKSTISEKEKSTISEKEKSTISEKENPTISEKEKSTISEKGKSTISEKEKSTISEKEKSTISEKEKSTAIPEKEKSTAIPEKEKSTAIPEKEKSTAIPEKSTAIPEKEKSPAIPEKEKSPAIPEKEKSPAIPEIGKSTTIPEKEKSTTIPEKEKTTAIPEKEKSMISKKGKSTAIPGKGKSMISEKEKSTAIPEKEKLTSVPEKEKSTVIPEKKNPTLILEKEKSTAIPENKKLAAIPEKEKSAVILEKEKSAAIPEKKKSAVIPEKEKAIPEKEKSSAIQKKEKSAVIPEKEKSSIPEKEKSSIPEKEESAAIPEKEKSAAIQEKEKSIAIPETGNSTILETEKLTATLEKEKSTAFPEKEKSISIPETANSTSFPEKEKSTSNKKKSTAISKREKPTAIQETTQSITIPKTKALEISTFSKHQLKDNQDENELSKVEVLNDEKASTVDINDSAMNNIKLSVSKEEAKDCTFLQEDKTKKSKGKSDSKSLVAQTEFVRTESVCNIKTSLPHAEQVDHLEKSKVHKEKDNLTAESKENMLDQSKLSEEGTEKLNESLMLEDKIPISANEKRCDDDKTIANVDSSTNSTVNSQNDPCDNDKTTETAIDTNLVQDDMALTSHKPRAKAKSNSRRSRGFAKNRKSKNQKDKRGLMEVDSDLKQDPKETQLQNNLLESQSFTDKSKQKVSNDVSDDKMNIDGVKPVLKETDSKADKLAESSADRSIQDIEKINDNTTNESVRVETQSKLINRRKRRGADRKLVDDLKDLPAEPLVERRTAPKETRSSTGRSITSAFKFDYFDEEAIDVIPPATHENDPDLADEQELLNYSHFYSVFRSNHCRETKNGCNIDGFTCNNYGYKLKFTGWLEAKAKSVSKKQVTKVKRNIPNKTITKPKSFVQQDISLDSSPSTINRRGRGQRGRGKKAATPVIQSEKIPPKAATPKRGRGKGRNSRGRTPRGRAATAAQNNADFNIPEGFLEILDNSREKMSDDEEVLKTPSRARKSKTEVSSAVSSDNECNSSSRKRSTRIQAQHQKKMSELAVEMQNEHRRLEQLAKKNTSSAKKPKAKQGPKVTPKPIFEPEIIEDTCIEVEGKPGGRKRRLRAVNMAKLTLLYDEESKDSEQSTSRSTEKSRRRRGTRGKRKGGYKPWDLSSGSSTTVEEISEEEEEEEEPEEQLVFNVNEDEFACEEVEEDIEPVIIRRARTAMKVAGGDEKECIVDDKPCSKCGKFDRPEWILLCDKCNDGYHTSCLVPEVYNIPDGDWFCQPCQHLFLCQCLSVELHKLEVSLKQREREELRKQRLAYVGISLDNVLKPEKKESESESEEESEHERERKVEVKKMPNEDSRSKLYGKRSSRARGNVNYQFKEYDELIASAIGDDVLDFKMEEFAEPAVEEKQSEDDDDDDDSFKGRLPPKRKRTRRLNNLDFSDEDDSGDDYKGLSTDTEHTPSVNTEISQSGSDAASGEWRIVKSRPKAKRRGGGVGGRRRKRGGRYSSSDEEDLESDGSSYRPATRRASQKQVSYRELSSDEEWGELPKRAPKRKKKETSSSEESEMSFRSDMSEQKPKKARLTSKWNKSSSESEENSDESSESQAEDSESNKQSAGEWKIAKSTEAGRIKINKKVIESDSESDASSKKEKKPKKRLNRVISDSEEEDDDDEEEDDDSSSESSENSDSDASSEEEENVQSKKVVKKIDTDSKTKMGEQEKVKGQPALKVVAPVAKDGKVKPKLPIVVSNRPRIIVTDKKVVAKPVKPSESLPATTTPKPQPDKPTGTTVTPVRVAQLPSNVAAVCRAVAANSHHVSSNQIVVQTVVVKTVPKGAIKEIKMVPSKIQYKDKIDGSEAESKKPVTPVTKEPQKSELPPAPVKPPIVAKPPLTKSIPVLKKVQPPREVPMPIQHTQPHRPFMNAAANPMRQPMMPHKNSAMPPQGFPPSMMRGMQQPHPFRGVHPSRFPNPPIDMQPHIMPQPHPAVRNSIPPQMYPGSPEIRSNRPMKAVPLRANVLPPSAYSSPPLEPINNSPIRPQQGPQPKSVLPPQPYSGSIVEPFSSADMDQGSDSREEVPLERIPCEPENVSATPYMGKTGPYEKENEYRPAKEAANYPYSMPEEKGFPSTYSPLSSLQEFTSRPSPLKPSLVEAYPTSSSPTRLTPLDSYPQSSSPKGFISLDTYSANRKRNTFSNVPDTEARPLPPPSDSYSGESRFPQEPFPPSSPSMQNRDPGTPPRLYSQFPDSYSSSRSPEFYQGQQYYPPEEGMPRGNFQSGYNPPEQVSQYNYMPNSMQQPNDGFMIDTILRARNEEDELSNVSGIVQYITQQ